MGNFRDLEVYEIIKDYKVYFTEYYKYCFTFMNSVTSQTKSGYKITVVVGGCSEDIYRLMVDETPVTVEELWPTYLEVEQLETKEKTIWSRE